MMVVLKQMHSPDGAGFGPRRSDAAPSADQLSRRLVCITHTHTHASTIVLLLSYWPSRF